MSLRWLLLPTALACDDFDSFGCASRAKILGFCDNAWGRQHCCETCSSGRAIPEPPNGCEVPKQKCVTWSCPTGSKQSDGVSCNVTRKVSAMCDRCSVVDSETCELFESTERTCQPDGSWSGREPSCRRFCDSGFTPPENPILPLVPASNEVFDAPTIEALDIEAAPFGDYLKGKELNKYMSKRFDMWGHWPVMFDANCEKKYGMVPGVHVANQYAQWIDWQGTGQPNNPEVWAQLKHYNATMVMFKSSGLAMDLFTRKYPFDEKLDKHWFHPHDTECDETPAADDGFDNAYCETLQQVFNMGYRAVFPDQQLQHRGCVAHSD